MAAVTARTTFWWVKFRECGSLLYRKRFLLKLRGIVFQSYVWPTILYLCEVWCLKECEILFIFVDIDPW